MNDDIAKEVAQHFVYGTFYVTISSSKKTLIYYKTGTLYVKNESGDANKNLEGTFSNVVIDNNKITFKPESYDEISKIFNYIENLHSKGYKLTCEFSGSHMAPIHSMMKRTGITFEKSSGNQEDKNLIKIDNNKSKIDGLYGYLVDSLKKTQKKYFITTADYSEDAENLIYDSTKKILKIDR